MLHTSDSCVRRSVTLVKDLSPFAGNMHVSWSQVLAMRCDLERPPVGLKHVKAQLLFSHFFCGHPVSSASVQLFVLCAVWQEGLLRSVSTTRSSELCLYLLRQANLELSCFSHLELQSFSKSSLPVQTMFPRAAQQQLFSDCSSQSCVLQTCLSWVATSRIFRQTQATRLSILSNACCHMNSFRQCLSLTLECLALQDAPVHSCHGVLQQ